MQSPKLDDVAVVAYEKLVNGSLVIFERERGGNDRFSQS